ncbi:DUF2339 domain-containing protein [Nonlabens ulvanivorans]|uniref:Membrane protein n=1 Tax=Nonlabens ulvanivorans TaxID=906888 RepID=A0A084JW49_NONUL|nr:DUF2339 domain-containing protein [Nonlabens ulvanivorans]KEZ93183.1 membrane protein [Nonlabens ulvanivorans]PRX13695.1 putative membrane protein DUF2339 [Nonlabens ulvanivorans]
MTNHQETIKQLIEQIGILSRKQEAFKYEIFELKNKLDQLQSSIDASDNVEKATLDQTDYVVKSEPIVSGHREWIDSNVHDEATIAQPSFQHHKNQNSKVTHNTPQKSKKLSPFRKSNLEKFIGENLLNKIGILILVIGIGIGAKYSIENELISPLTRIVLGYLSAIGLLGFGIKLKKKYESYSAVLVSGAIVILYFITFFAYSFYELIPQTVAFAMMVLFTVFTIVASLNYNRQIIAHLGLVGAYAVPFLLSNDSGRVEVLFSYIAIINIGILIIAFKKYWKPLYYSAFGLTWLIYLSWFVMDYSNDSHFMLALSFLLLFYLTFYLTFLAYKLVKKEGFAATDIVMLLMNSFIFYGLGYAILNDNAIGEDYLGLFTLGNAVIHFIVATIIYKKQLSDKKLFYLATALVLAFISIAIPVQLDGNWVTLLWTAQAALLFWLGTSKNISIYEKLSYPLIALAFISLIHDWSYNYDSYYHLEDNLITPLLNTSFLTSILFTTAIGFIVFLQRKGDFISSLKEGSTWLKIVSYAVPILFVFSLYYSFRLEIEAYWNQLFSLSELENKSISDYVVTVNDYSLRDFKIVWVINYTLLFLGFIGYLNYKKIKNIVLENSILVLTIISVVVFLTQGLYALSELRDAYIEPSIYYNRGSFYLIIRYISFAFLGFSILSLYRYIKKDDIHKGFKIAYDVILHITIVWVVSSELIHWLDLAGARDSYKLGLSILWGVYSFLLIGFGILKNKPYLRIGGMALFAITLIKLFFYDIAHLNTISKTIVFVSLGILLLIISFLYNKNKNKINYTSDTNSEKSIEETKEFIDEFDNQNDI